MRRPRVRASDGSGELPVASYQSFSGTEVLGREAMEQMLAGLSSRRYGVGLEPVGEHVAPGGRRDAGHRQRRPPYEPVARGGRRCGRLRPPGPVARTTCPTTSPSGHSRKATGTTSRIYAEGIATGNATFETDVPDRDALDAGWLAGHRWVVEVAGAVAGWAAAKPVSARPVYAGVAETSIYVGDGFRGRGVGKALIYKQVTATDAGGLWAPQTSIFPENEASLNLHRWAGFRSLAVHERIGSHHGVWRDTVFLERRRAESLLPVAASSLEPRG